MVTYSSFVFPDKLISPINGYSCKRLTKQNIKQFGFESINQLHELYHDFPVVCENSRIKQHITSSAGSRIFNSIIKQTRIDNYLTNPKFCKNCNYQLPYEKRNNKFCSTSCAASHNNTIRPPRSRQSRLKTSIAINRYNKEHGIIDTNEKRRYWKLCAFKISKKLYSELPGFDLFQQYGMRHSSKNPNGVCKDHIMSKFYGWQHKINPDIISHPANCQFLLCKDNASKYVRSDITIEELLERIKIWNKNHS